MLENAQPGAGTRLNVPPVAVVLRFESALELPFCQILLEDQNGSLISSGTLQLEGENHNILHLPLPPLPPGHYQVIWSVVARDGHRTEGDYSFTIQ